MTLWILAALHLALLCETGLCSTWSEWWTYDGISGPDFWGLVNPEWNLCSKGRRQSPVNVDPKQLLYDPRLKHIRIDKHKVSGYLVNTGRDIRIQFDDPSPHYINISGGPLSYQYRITDVIVHFGSLSSLGSEHTINGVSFPAEVQILGYNTDLYGNMTQAVTSSNGLAIVTLLGQVSSTPNAEFDAVAQHIKLVRYKGDRVHIGHLSVHNLLPVTEDFITYEGSLTQPGCQETVTWIIINKPIYISYVHLMAMRDVMQGDENNPKVPMENNCRPTMPLHHRPVRTNINFQSPTKECTMEKQLYYQALVERS